jgi:flagellar capping protein FliD
VNGTTVTTGLLYGNSEVRALGTQLRAMIFQPTAGATGSLTRLADLGLDFAGTTNTLSVKDPTALTNALASTHVADLFASNSTSSMGQIGALLDRTIGFNGSLSQNITRLNQKSQNYDTQIANMQRQLDAQKQALTNEFIQMESAQSTLQQQSKSLASTLGSTTG